MEKNIITVTVTMDNKTAQRSYEGHFEDIDWEEKMSEIYDAFLKVGIPCEFCGRAPQEPDGKCECE